MENEKLICKTNAEMVLHYAPLKKNGFVFHYVKKWQDCFQHFINCNGEIFGTFLFVYTFYVENGKATWTAFQTDLTLEYSDNGKNCLSIHKNVKEYLDEKWQQTLKKWHFFLEDMHRDYEQIREKRPEEIYNEQTHVLEYPHKKQEYFVTGKKKFGPYLQIYQAYYLDEEHFQFSYVKT